MDDKWDKPPQRMLTAKDWEAAEALNRERAAKQSPTDALAALRKRVRSYETEWGSLVNEDAFNDALALVEQLVEERGRAERLSECVENDNLVLQEENARLDAENRRLREEAYGDHGRAPTWSELENLQAENATLRAERDELAREHSTYIAVAEAARDYRDELAKLRAETAGLEARLIRNLRRVAWGFYGASPLWAIVRDAFGVGSTRAQEMCRAHGLDPDTYRDSPEKSEFSDNG